MGQQALPGELGERLEKVQPEFEQLTSMLSHARELLHSVAIIEPRIQGESEVAVFRFPEGIVPDSIVEQAQLLKIGFSKACTLLEKVSKDLNDAMDGDVPGIDRWQAEQLYPEVGAMLMRLQNQCQLWQSYITADPDGVPPTARWLKWTSGPFGEELELFCSPILSADTLSGSLWSQCYGAVVTSATLASLGNFNRYRMRSGIPEASRCVIVPSPFVHGDAASLVVPAMSVDPRQADEHTDALIELMPTLLQQCQGSLVLFSSRRQMQDVYAGLDHYVQEQILVQDDYSRQELLKRHRERIDEDETSVLFGLASLAEGIDLPGRYCEHVIIARIPFAVPDDPVEAALAEWLENQGRNPFMEITVPDAAIRLVQACGRLLRTEQDTGQITLLDRRVVTQRYGQMILNSLPPFAREIDYRNVS